MTASKPERAVGNSCKYCQSEHVIKYGHYKGVQRYYCIDCRRKFVSNETIPGMWYPDQKVSDAIWMYYEGMSLSKIRDRLVERDNYYISRGSIYNWVHRITQRVEKETGKYQPQVGRIWTVFDSVIRIQNKKSFIRDIVDAKTRFLLASELTEVRPCPGVQILVETACRRAGICPEIIFHDSHQLTSTYDIRIYKAATAMSGYKQIALMYYPDFVGTFRPNLKTRNELIQNLKSFKSAKAFIVGWHVHYNFYKPNYSLSGETPAKMSGIELPHREEMLKQVLKQLHNDRVLSVNSY